MLDAIIVEPSLDKRTHLREIARDFCKSVVVSPTLQDGLERIKGSKNCDVIYVSSRFDIETATQFIMSSKQTETGKDSANLLITPSESFNETFLARLMLNGFDGMLLEPASVETFKDSAELALKARNVKLKDRQKRSISVLIRALADQLDELAAKKRLKQVSILAEDRFRKSGKELRVLDMENLESYFESLQGVFEGRKAIDLGSDSGLRSSSSRVIRRQLSK